MKTYRTYLMQTGVLLLITCLCATSHAANSPLSDRLKVLAVVGCEPVPEMSSADDQELQCNNDRSYFLCVQMQARDARLNCAIDEQASKIDWSHHDAAVLIASPAFAKIVKAEPCVAWVYPELGDAKREDGGRCAADILKVLQCDASPSGTLTAVCPPSAQAACSALLETGYVQDCSLKTGVNIVPTHR